MTELQAFKAMLERAGIGHGLRTDHNPPGTAVQVEADDLADDREWTMCEFSFDADGKLKTVEAYEGQTE